MATEQTDQTDERPVVLTIAGSDSGGGAGIQADLKTFTTLGVFGATAITCLTAQNPVGVQGIVALDPEFVRRQIKAVCDAFPVSAAKTGMLYNAEIVRAVAMADVRQGIPVLVVDPVMVSATGASLLQDDAVDALCSDLLPQARVITPNLHEAEILCGRKIHSLAEMQAAARDIGDRFDTACVIKGGHLPGAEVYDVVYDEGEGCQFAAPRLEVPENHGAGCCFSAALTAFLAQGELLNDAVERAKSYVHCALESAVAIGRHYPLNFNQAGLEAEP